MDSFDPTFFDSKEGEDRAAKKARIEAYFRSIKDREPYEIYVSLREGWSRYKGLKYVRNRGWWKDSGLHQLCRNMVALGLKDAPIVTKHDHHQWPGSCASLYWMAAHDITETDKRGIFYYRHNPNPDPRFTEEEDE